VTFVRVEDERLHPQAERQLVPVGELDLEAL